MKNWLWLVLASLALMTGCAQGYTDSRPAYQAPPTMSWYQNPETESQYHKNRAVVDRRRRQPLKVSRRAKGPKYWSS